MHMSATLTIGAQPQRVLEILGDEAFVQYTCQESDTQLLGLDADFWDSGAVTIVTRRTMKSDAIPANFRSFVGDKLEIRQTEAWAEPELSTGVVAGTRFGTFDLEIVGAPVRIAGSVRLEPTDVGSLLIYSGDVSASIPLFGAMVEKAVGQAITQVLTEEEALIARWLAR